MDRLTPAQLDEILALQLTVAWVGEAAGEPARLGWWKSDLVDAEGGGDLFTRLVPRTAPWAALVLLREVARRVDSSALRQSNLADRVHTLFHLGFRLDEQLTDRLNFHRQHAHTPDAVFGAQFIVGGSWSKPHFETQLANLGTPKITITPGGRSVTAAGAGGVELVRLLAAGLLPLTAKYPLPYAEIGK